MVEKYSKIFPKMRSLEDEQLQSRFSIHMIHNLEYLLENNMYPSKKEEIKKLIAFFESIGINSSLDDVLEKGFSEEKIYNKLLTTLKQPQKED